MVDINRCIFHPRPGGLSSDTGSGAIHWDTDPRVPPGSLRGVVLLTDVVRNGAVFSACLRYTKTLTVGCNRTRAQRTPIPLTQGGNLRKRHKSRVKAGDVISWSTKLPHGSAVNLSNRLLRSLPCSLPAMRRNARNR
jgi:hypothetical protein